MIPLGLYGAARPVISTIITDSFNRADNASSLGTTDTGEAWEVSAGTWGIVGNRAYRSAGATGQRSHASVDVGSMSHRVEVRIPDIGTTGGYPSLAARFQDSDNCYFLQLAPAPTVFTRRSGGVNTTLGASMGTTTFSHLIALSCVETESGTVLTAYRDGAELGTYTDTASGRPSGTRAGLFLFGTSTNTRFDDFRAETL